MNRDSEFLPQNTNYNGLIVYKKSLIILDITQYFVDTFLRGNPRLGLEQMLPAARCGKQNISEGYVDGATSREMELKLFTVAKGSLKELLEDYQDFLRGHNFEIWPVGSPKHNQARQVCRQHDDVEWYMQRIPQRTAETIANIAIILLKQIDYLLFRLIEQRKKAFLEQGGIREQMTRARLQVRDRQNHNPGFSGNRGNSGIRGNASPNTPNAPNTPIPPKSPKFPQS